MCSGGMRKFQVSIGVVKQFDPTLAIPSAAFVVYRKQGRRGAGASV
jgi:hypothetical protein